MDDVRFQKYGSFSSDPHATRVRRAISWGMAAETATGEDEQFIFYWITLNATYGNEEMAAANERLKRATFFEKICELDAENKINKALIAIQNQLRVFIDNKYMYDEYWKLLKNEVTPEYFENMKIRVRKKIYSGLMSKEDEIDVLDYLFDLISLLRNQIFHGLATYQSSVNREQLRPCIEILKSTVPIIVEIVLEHPEVDWGAISYPYIKQD